MKSLITALTLSTLLSVFATTQVLTVTTPAPTGQTIRIEFHNNTATTLYLLCTAPWNIHDSHGRWIFTPIAGDAIVAVPPCRISTWTWDQLVPFMSPTPPHTVYSRLVKPGKYELRFRYCNQSQTKVKTIKLPFVIEDAVLIPTGLPKPGARMSLFLQSPSASGCSYQVALAFHDAPTRLPGNRTLRLWPDELFLLSVSSRCPLFRSFAGTLDTQGFATATIDIPKSKDLLGLRFYAAFLTLDPKSPGGIFNHSLSQAITIR